MRQREARGSHACLRFPGGSDPMVARVIGAMEKESPKSAKLKRLWDKITAADE